MTPREAVNWLINLTADIGKSEHHTLWHYEQALYEIRDMLQSLDGKDTDVPSNDTIYRQDAIDALCSVCGNDCDKTEFVYDAPQWDQVIMCPEHYVLTTLPSAKPEHLVKEPDGLVKDLVNDTVSRQMAIKEAKELYDMGDCYCDRASMIGMLNSLPSAQPKSYKEKLKEIADALSEKFAYMNTCLNERDIILGYLGVKRPSEIHCNTDCTNIKCESHYCYKKTPSAQPDVPDICVGDTISRQDAIKFFTELWECIRTIGDREEWEDVCVTTVNEIKSAQPERPRGHWIFDFAHNEMTCSECGRTFTGGFDLENADNFCRHCGSDNRGEQDG